MYRPERLRLTKDTPPVILGKAINTSQHSLSCTYNCVKFATDFYFEFIPLFTSKKA